MARIAAVLGGGGSLGAIQVDMLPMTADHDVVPDLQTHTHQ